jgi:hypothetical protein
MWWIRLLVPLLIVGCAGQSPRPGGPVPDWHVKRAVFVEDKLWVLTNAGTLMRGGEFDRFLLVDPAPPMLDLCSGNGYPIGVLCDDDKQTPRIRGVGGCGTWQVSARTNPRWPAVVTLPSEGDELVAIDCRADGFTLVTSRRLIEIAVDQPRAIPLSQALPPGGGSAIHVQSDRILVGFSAGEQGGGLRSIDRRTGTVTVIERNESGQRCAGPLDTQCDPVNGIGSMAWKPGCVVTSVGSMYPAPRGRLVEVCPDGVNSLFEAAMAPAGAGSPGNAAATAPFFGVSERADGLWILGVDGVYRLSSTGMSRVHPLPQQFKTMGSVKVSFDVPGFVVVMTSVGRPSPTGSAALLVPR